MKGISSSNKLVGTSVSIKLLWLRSASICSSCVVFNKAEGSSEAARLAALIASARSLSMAVGSMMLPQYAPSGSPWFLVMLLLLLVTRLFGSISGPICFDSSRSRCMLLNKYQEWVDPIDSSRGRTSYLKYHQNVLDSSIRRGVVPQYSSFDDQLLRFFDSS